MYGMTDPQYPNCLPRYCIINHLHHTIHTFIHDQVKCLGPSSSPEAPPHPSDSSLVQGVVVRKNIAHRKMRAQV